MVLLTLSREKQGGAWPEKDVCDDIEDRQKRTVDQTVCLDCLLGAVLLHEGNDEHASCTHTTLRVNSLKQIHSCLR